MKKDKTVTVRVPAELADRLAKATDTRKNPYAPNASQIMLRGLDVALKEVERK